MRLLLNIDVPDLAPAERFYVEAFGLRPGRRLGEDRLELLGAVAPIPVREAAWGRIVQIADPFGHGWCLLRFPGNGYDEITT